MIKDLSICILAFLWLLFCLATVAVGFALPVVAIWYMVTH